jgi:uncharacterized protein
MKNNVSKYVILLTFVSVCIGGLLFTLDLEQKNKETIFLTAQGIKSYSIFKKKFNEKSIIVLKKQIAMTNQDTLVTEFINQTTELQKFCSEECNILTHKTFKSVSNTLFPLKGKNYLSFILIGENNSKKVKEIISKLLSLPFWGEIGKNLHLSGIPFTNFLLDQYSKDIKEVLFPSLFLGVFLCLVFMLRSLKISMLLFFPALLSCSLSLLATKVFLNESNLITSIIPLLMFVINFSLVLHIYFTSCELQSLKSALNDKMKPIFLMIVTTFIGFLSLYFSELKAISIFGLMAAALILVTTLSSIVWMYLFDSIIKPEKLEISYQSIVYKIIKFFFGSFYSYKVIFIIAISSILLGLLTFNRIPIITDATKYFPKSSGLKESIDSVAKDVIGTPILELIIKKKKALSIEEFHKLNKIEEKIIQSLYNLNNNTDLLSLNSFIKSINLNYSDVKKIPDSEIAYLTLRSQIPDSIREGFPIEEDYRITILSPPVDVKEYQKYLESIRAILKNTNYKFSFNGIYYHLMIAQKKMISTLFTSFLISLLVISFIAFLAFKKIKLFFIFIFVNTIPVFLSIALMYLFGLSFNIATVMTYSISLGLIVDSSFHIIHGLDKENLNYDFFFKTIILPVFGGSLLLTIAFLMFSLNNFLPIKEFGICLGMIIFIAMTFDLKILPTIYLGKSSID